MPTKTATTERKLTFEVTSHILRGEGGKVKSYFKGDTITFPESEQQEHIDALIAVGALEGRPAEEIAEQIIINEAMTKMKGMTKEEQVKLWRSYTRMSEEERKVREAREARIKEDAKAARSANFDQGETERILDADTRAKIIAESEDAPAVKGA